MLTIIPMVTTKITVTYTKKKMKRNEKSILENINQRQNII